MYAFKITDWGTAADRFKPMWVISTYGQIDVNGTKYELHEFDKHILISRRGERIKVQTGNWIGLLNDSAHEELECERMDLECQLAKRRRGFELDDIIDYDQRQFELFQREAYYCVQRVFWLPPLPDLVVAKVVRCFLNRV